MKTKKKKKNTIYYPVWIILVSLLLFCLIIGRILQLGLSKEVDGTNLQELANSRTTKKEIISAKRGSIYSANEDVLATNVASYKLIAYLDEKRTTNEKRPQHVVEKEKTANLIAPILGCEASYLLERLNKENVYQTEFGVYGKNLDEITKKKIEDLDLPGIDFEESFKRYYPKGDFSSYTIGYAKSKNEEANSVIAGEMGIEKYYDKLLRGKDGFTTYQKDLKGYKIPNTPVITKDAEQGKDIYLTIDSNVQFYLEQAMKTQSQTYSWEWFNITVLDAKSGAVLATASSPSFDPNKRNIVNYLDLSISSPYEPGSTMKTFTYMAAMENGVYNGGETYYSGTYTTKDGTVIGDWNRNGWGTITFDRGYALSSNVGVINLINRHMNSTMLRTYFKKLGFGKKTGISLPNEAKGYLGFKYETEIYNAGFGQGVTTTPLQNVQAMTPLTNDGMLIRPYIVSKIVDPETGEEILKNERTEIERVASTQTVEKMKQLLDDCVNAPGMTGSGYRLDSGELIGKTGTAQIAAQNGKGYLSGKEDIISSFSGIYPKSDPQIIIYASVKKPSGGSQKPISNAVKDIVLNVSKYYGNKDTVSSSIPVYEYKLDNLVNKTVEETTNKLTANNIKYIVLGNGSKVIKQYPEKGSEVTSTDVVYLITNDNLLTVPDFTGLSSKVTKGLANKLNIKIKTEGVGYVTAQSVPPGTQITEGLEIKFTLSPKFVITQPTEETVENAQ